jgi:hypothetical protein
MQASKLSFFESTKFQLNSNPILKSKSAKSKLRRTRVIDFIKEYPVGSKFTKSDLIYAAGYTQQQYGQGFAFIQRMEKDGIIFIENTKKFKKEVNVLKDPRQDGRTTVIAPPATDEPVPTEDAPEDAEDEVMAKDIDFIIKIEKIARTFAWKENSDSLREFVKSLK